MNIVLSVLRKASGSQSLIFSQQNAYDFCDNRSVARSTPHEDTGENFTEETVENDALRPLHFKDPV